MALVTFLVENIRPVKPSARVLASDPERVLTVNGTFYPAILDAKGHVIRKPDAEAMSYASKPLYPEQVSAEGFVLDVVNGILTIPAGQRGRTAAEGLSQDAVNDILSAYRNPAE